jgi:hypothetical protein
MRQLKQAGVAVTAFDLMPAGVHDVLLVAGHKDAGLRLQSAIMAARAGIAAEWPGIVVRECRVE